MQKPVQYIVVDDDRTSNLICQLTIQRFDKDASVSLFTNPEEALMNIDKNYFSSDTECCVLFLDLNMPTMTGWDFLEAFEKFDPSLRKGFQIYVLTSAIEDLSGDVIRYPSVSGFLSKPLTLKAVTDVWNNLSKNHFSRKLSG